jgi:FKBP12-rapamycin complex-associated protein
MVWLHCCHEASKQACAAELYHLCCAWTGELQGAALTRLALQTLGSFDFGSTRLLEFVRDHVTPYLDDASVTVRRAAAAAAVAVLHRTAEPPPGSRASAHPQVCLCSVSEIFELPCQRWAGLAGSNKPPPPMWWHQVHTRAVEAVVGRLLMAACTDTSVSVRKTVLKSIQAPSSLDTYLAQADWCCSRSLECFAWLASLEKRGE